MVIGFDPNLLTSFYQSRLPTATSSSAANSLTSALQKKNSATANDVPPWTLKQPAQAAMDAKVLGTTNFLDTSKVPLSTSTATDARTEQDNQKLFALYSAVNTLAYVAKMGQREGVTPGQLAGLNTRFQAGMKQVQDYIAKTTFNNFTLQAANPQSSVTSSASVPLGGFDYSTRTLVNNENIANALPGIDASDSFTIAIKKGGTTTDVDIDLSTISGPITLDAIITKVNQSLSAGGFTTRFQKTVTSGTYGDKKATYGLKVAPGANETVNLSSADAAPSLYLAGSAGRDTPVTTGTGSATSTQQPDQQGRLVKLSDLDTAPAGTFNVSAKPSNGTTTVQATATDASGNVYVVGNATGDFGNQINQGTQDSYLTKYDSAGNVVWTRMLGSTGSASGYSLATDPTGGVVVAGSTNADLVTGAVADGNTDTYVAKYDANGNQTWIKQVQTLAKNQPATVTVDSTGNVFVGGQVSGGVIGSGQTAVGGTDAYVVKLDNKGAQVYQQQFGTGAADNVSGMVTAADGSLYVASVQNGHAIVSKYANGDARTAAVWTQDLGDLQAGGAIAGLTLDGSGALYITGTTQNGNLTASGAATVAQAATGGGTDAFVFKLSDNGATASADFVSYVGTGLGDKAGGVALGNDGTIYLTGSTMGTFAGQSRAVQSVSNMFAAALDTNGASVWTKQFGGTQGISSGTGIAIDNSGSSVLDALGLPRGTINPNQTVDLAAATTLRAGDSFQIKIQGNAARTATIRIEKGETLQSLSTKINIQLQTTGKASVNYTGGAAGLKIAVNPGVTLDLVAGPKDFDALARLGIPAGTLSAAPTGKQAALNTSAGSNSTTAKPAFGLGLGTRFDLSTKQGVNVARGQLLTVLSSIQTAYQKSNNPDPAPGTAPAAANGATSPYLQSQLGNSSLALSLLGTA